MAELTPCDGMVVDSLKSRIKKEKEEYYVLGGAVSFDTI
jgi:hypothetical protein